MLLHLVYSDPLSSPWLLLLIYGPPHANGRARFWKCLENLVNAFSSPWLVIWDFNCLYSNLDKKGGRYLNEGSTKSFSNFVHGTGPIDLGFIGSRFTWSNKREGLANIKELLDKAVCNQEWQCLFPKARVKHLIASTSNHAPIILDTHLDWFVRAKPFRFEAMWARDESSFGIVEKAWQGNVEGSQCFKLAREIQQTSEDLMVWNRNQFGYAKTKIKETEARIKEVQERAPTKENLELEATLYLELDEWLERVDLKWRQKSRELWIKEGDQNTRFFYLSTLVRRRRILIK
uniref:Uncharacterized protein n=1 Tax=Quercus lobata TaxID=97700 RepID=A0A7N2MCG6_QUELO